jgi:hypothetical protein
VSVWIFCSGIGSGVGLGVMSSPRLRLILAVLFWIGSFLIGSGAGLGMMSSSWYWLMLAVCSLAEDFIGVCFLSLEGVI